MPLRFVLDQNFPLVATNIDWPPSFEVIRLSSIAPHLTRGYEDWEILQELDSRGDINAFITNDERMLALPSEMITLQRSRLVLIVTHGAGRQPLRATGLLMVYLPAIARRVTGEAQCYVLKAGALTPQEPRKLVNEIPEHRNVSPPQLIAAEMVKMEARRRPQP